MGRSSGISRLNRAELTDQVVDLNKSVDISILSPLLEPFVTVDPYV
jgi:hypothetical protein